MTGDASCSNAMLAISRFISRVVYGFIVANNLKDFATHPYDLPPTPVEE